MLQKLQESRTLEHDMALAIDNHEFVVYYQPIVDSFSNEIYGYEALIRWIHPVKGILSPDYFISVAEKTGMINQIGKNVLELACREAVSGRFRQGSLLTSHPFSWARNPLRRWYSPS